MKFSELSLDPLLQAAIDQTGFTECTPIQEQALPTIMDGKDVAGLAQTGTGKTAAFLLPLMERILRSRPQPPDQSEEQKALTEKRAFKDWRPQNFILVLCPTRELAEQAMDNISKFGTHSGLRGVAIYGGTSYDKQREGLKNGVEFIAATPGRLLDLYKENLVDLKQVRAIVFDEADRMFDMGFKDDMKFILSRIPRERQYLVFSATLNFDVLNTAYQFGSEPIEINISRDATRADNVKDELFHVAQEEKGQHLLSLLKMKAPKQAIVFTNFKMNVDRIAKFLIDNGMPAMGISSLLTQAQRTKVMDMFKAENNMNIMVATDVAARGLDIKGVDLVINFELPMDAESYVHRIGRTGRAGEMGTAYSLVSDRDVDSLMRVEEYLKNKIAVGFLEDKDLVKEYRPMPRGDFSPGRVLSEAMNEGRPPRKEFGDRGPRQGGRGGGRGGDRGPRRDDRGPRRDDRGPRGEGGARADGPREGGQQGARAEHRPHGGGGDRGPRRDDRGPRREGGGQGRGGENRGASAPRREPGAPRPQGASAPHAKTGNGSGRRHEKPRGASAPHRKSPAPPKTVGAKVKSIFKRLFGG